MTSWADELLARNERIVSAGDHATPSNVPVENLIIVTCMDSRVEPLEVFGLKPGDVHVLRNAGGRVTDDVLRSLAVSVAVFGTQHVLVMHHTDCGMEIPAEELRRKVEETNSQPFDGDLLSIDATSIDMDVNSIRETPSIPSFVSVAGFIYNVTTGAVQEILPAEDTSPRRAT